MVAPLLLFYFSTQDIVVNCDAAGWAARAGPAKAGRPAPEAGPSASLLRLLDLLPVVAPAVVLFALVWIGQDPIGHADLLEPGLGLFVVGVQVRVVLVCELAVSLPNLLFRG